MGARIILAVLVVLLLSASTAWTDSPPDSTDTSAGSSRVQTRNTAQTLFVIGLLFLIPGVILSVAPLLLWWSTTMMLGMLAARTDASPPPGQKEFFRNCGLVLIAIGVLITIVGVIIYLAQRIL